MLVQMVINATEVVTGVRCRVVIYADEPSNYYFYVAPDDGDTCMIELENIVSNNPLDDDEVSDHSGLEDLLQVPSLEDPLYDPMFDDMNPIQWSPNGDIDNPIIID